MLVYVLRSAADRIMRPLTDAELPPTLEAAIKHEEEMTKRAVAEKALAHLYRQVGVITLDYLRKVGGEGCDLLPLKPAFKPPIVRLERAATVARSKRAIAEAAGLNPDDVRLWALYKRRNDTVRIGRHYCSAKRQLLTIDAVFAESLLDLVQYVRHRLPDRGRVGERHRSLGRRGDDQSRASRRAPRPTRRMTTAPTTSARRRLSNPTSRRVRARSSALRMPAPLSMLPPPPTLLLAPATSPPSLKSRRRLSPTLRSTPSGSCPLRKIAQRCW
jgi:hypothetical protein